MAMAEYKKEEERAKAEAKQHMTPEEYERCSSVIHGAAIECGVIGAIPIPVADAIPISLIQIHMIHSIGEIFGEDFSEETAKKLLETVAATLVGRSLTKVIPVAGWFISAAIAAGITEALGWIIANDMTKRTEPIRRMREKMQPFFAGTKSAKKDHPEDYQEYIHLRTECEEIVKELEEGHPFKKTYDEFAKLCLS